MSGRTHIVDLIDVERYPVHQPVVAAYAELLQMASAAYRRTGFCRFEGFFHDRAVTDMAQQAAHLAPLAYRLDGKEACVAYDVLPLEGPLRACYESDGMALLISGVTGEATLFRSADPLAAMTLSIMREGDVLAPSAAGPAVQATVAIASALAGGATAFAGGETFVDAPGTLTIFDNHRVRRSVTAVRGSRLRYEARMLFGLVPGVDSTDKEKLRRFGRLPGPGRRA